MTERLTVAELLVRALEEEGVSHVFGVPGEENEDLLFALEESAISFIPTRHEQGAAFMANVWGRLTGRAGVCLATLGPGATNLITGVADANLDKAPLVAITAQGGRDRLHHESHQTLDIVSMFRPVTKWNSAVAGPATVTEVVRKAFKVAESEKPGATHIELSEDVASLPASGDVRPLPRSKVRRPGPDQKAIEEAARLISKANRPLVLAGNGAIRRRASEHLTRLATTFDIPVVSTFMGKGSISDRLSQSLFTVGLGFRDVVQDVIDAADVIITVGYDIAEYPPDRWNRDERRPIVHIDFDPAEVYRWYLPTVEVVADICLSLIELQSLLASTPADFESEWYHPTRQRILDDHASYRLETSPPWNIPAVLNLLRTTLPDEGLLISDVGSHKLWIARNFPSHTRADCVISNGLASMGIALPGAIAAALAHPGRPVVAVMGDGGFLMNVQELETAHRLGVAATIVVLNDDDYGLISWKQRMSRGRSTGTRIGNPDMVTLAHSFGMDAFRPQNPDDLATVLEASIRSQNLTLIEVQVDPGVNDELVARFAST